MNVLHSAALQGYLLLARCMRPVWRWALHRRLQRGKETPASLQQKWVVSPPARPAGPLVWGHAVGVGEAMALAGLFANMGKLWPDAHFLITTTARTSGDALQKNGLPPRTLHQFAPVDTPDAAQRFLRHWQPALAVWCEMDLWPALVHATARAGIPHVLVNARLNAKSLAKRRWGRWIYQALLPGFNQLWAQNAETRAGLVSLGASAAAVTVTGTIKSMAAPLRCDAVQLQQWQEVLAQRPLWLLASSHPGEEQIALQAHALLRERHPTALLVIAPRAPLRGAAVAAMCPGATPLRSAGTALPGHAVVYVADTVGEMGLWYRLAPVACMGGSFARVGGHNPHEPAALGCHVLHGPHVWNFAESYADLDHEGWSQPVADAAEVAAAVAQVWSRPGRRIRTDGDAQHTRLQSLVTLAQR